MAEMQHDTYSPREWQDVLVLLISHGFKVVADDRTEGWVKVEVP